jgi:hypothetical protein
LSQQDDALLLTFLSGVREDLQTAVNDYKLYAAEDWWYLQTNVGETWHDVLDNFPVVLRALSNREYDREKLAAGLFGTQLKLKIDVWTKARIQAKQIWTRIKSAAGRIPASIVHLLFDCAQTILGSLSFIPGIDAIEEFKSTIESIADASKQVSFRSSMRTDVEKVRMYFGFMKDLSIGLLIGGLFSSILAGTVLEYNYGISPTLWWVAYPLAAVLLVFLFFGFRLWRNSVEKLGKEIDQLLQAVQDEKPVKDLGTLLSFRRKKSSNENSKLQQES